jgi:hypothetical protein
MKVVSHAIITVFRGNLVSQSVMESEMPKVVP